jgi:hypothetical protein
VTLCQFESHHRVQSPRHCWPPRWHDNKRFQTTTPGPKARPQSFRTDLEAKSSCQIHLRWRCGENGSTKARQEGTPSAQLSRPGDCPRGVLFAKSAAPRWDAFPVVSRPPPGQGIRRLKLAYLKICHEQTFSLTRGLCRYSRWKRTIAGALAYNPTVA